MVRVSFLARTFRLTCVMIDDDRVVDEDRLWRLAGLQYRIVTHAMSCAWRPVPLHDSDS